MLHMEMLRVNFQKASYFFLVLLLVIPGKIIRRITPLLKLKKIKK